MPRMGNLAVVAYRQAYREKTGQDMELIEAIREIYGKGGL